MCTAPRSPALFKKKFAREGTAGGGAFRYLLPTSFQSPPNTDFEKPSITARGKVQ